MESVRVRESGLRPRLPRRLVAAAAALVGAAAVLGTLHATGAAARDRAARPATTGVVAIDTNLRYQNEAAAGTGMVISPGGEVLTNNHVIRGATTIHVVLPGTGRSYAARVVGYDVAADVAVLQLARASGLATVALGDSASLRTGERVRAVGNAGGTGSLVSTSGTVTGIMRTITASDGQSTEQLHGLIRTNAALQPGDSGGPLLDGSGRVIGMDTAASAGFAFRSGVSEGYAIPIDRALAIARRITAGHASAAVHVGATAFLGVSVSPPGRYRGSGSGALVTGVVPGSAADRAGLSTGVVITELGGHTVSSSASLVALVQRLRPGSTVHLTWYDGLGARATASVRLASGPPQ